MKKNLLTISFLFLFVSAAMSQNAGVTAILNPVANTIQGSTQLVTVEIKNFGVTSLTSIPIEYSINGIVSGSETYLGTLLPGSTTVFSFSTFFIVPAGIYSVCVETLVPGDTDLSNDVLCITSNGGAVLSLNYSDDFENPPSSWSDSAASVGTYWQLGTPNYGITNSAHSGTKAWDINLNGTYAASAHCVLTSPVFDFTNAVDATFSFWQNRNVNQFLDGMWVQYSVNGSLWTQLGSVGDPLGTNWYIQSHISFSNFSGWDGSSNGWVKSSYNLSMFNGVSTLQLRFNFTSSSSGTPVDGISIDDISVANPAPLFQIDAGVSNVLAPSATPGINLLQPVIVAIKNFGTQNLTSIPVSYSVNNVTQGTTTWTGNLLSYSYVLDTLGWITIPSTNFILKAYTQLADSNAINDTTFINCQPVVSSLTTAMTCNTYDPCVTPQQINFLLHFTCPGLYYGDIIASHIFWGDGTDTIVYHFPYGNNFYDLVYHQYLFTGTFSTQIISSDLTGLIDSSTNYNQIILSPACGNVTGEIYFDQNNDCNEDTSEIKLSNSLVMALQGGNLVSTKFSDTSGVYNFNLPTGTTYDIQVNNYYNVSNALCPSGGILPAVVVPSTGNDLGFQSAPNFDLQVSSYCNGVVPGLTRHLYVTTFNNNLFAVNAVLKVILDTSKITYTSALPAAPSIVGDTLIWNIPFFSLSSGIKIYSIDFLAKTGLQIGDTVYFKCIVEPVTGDIDTSNNTSNTFRKVTASCDPNEKSVFPEGEFPGGRIHNNQELQYAIQFQNTGNDTAHNVFILDTLDADLDLLSLQIIGNSHPMTVDILSGNVLKFNFNHIMLPDSNMDEQHSHGFVSYRIYPKNNLANGTQLTNTAYIYFDFNLPVVTNTTLSTIDLFLSVPKIPETENSFQLFPNPANDQLTIHISENNFHGELTMYDFLGKEIFRKNISKNDEVVDLKKFPAGIYSVRLSNEKKSLVRKVVVVH